MKQPTRQMCIDYIRQLVTCENFAQVCFIVDHMPKEIAEEMKRTTKPVGIIPPLPTEGITCWVKERHCIEQPTLQELTELLITEGHSPGENYVKVVVTDKKAIRHIRKFHNDEAARTTNAWIQNRRR